MLDPSTPAAGASGAHECPADPDPADAPSVGALRRTIVEQTALLTGPTVHESVAARVHRVLTCADELLALLSGDHRAGSTDVPVPDPTHDLVRDTVARAIAWSVESIGAYRRLPHAFAHGHTVGSVHAPLLRVVDDLDLLGLTLDHAYDAAHRRDADHARRQHAVLLERFPTSTRPDGVETGIGAGNLDDRVVRDRGLEVGEDGIPRLPVPEQPVPRRDPGGPGPGPQETP